MTLYSLILFVHVTAVLGLCAALSFEVLSLFHLRRASTVIEARRWIEPVPGLPLVAMGSLLIIFFSGNLPGHANVGLQLGMAKGDGGSCSTHRAAGR